MQFPNDIQCALMFERAAPDLDAVLNRFIQVEAMTSGVHYNPLEARSGAYHQLFGSNDLMVTLEYLDRPADMAVFRGALSSTVTKLMFPDVGEVLERHRSHILINIRSGAMPDMAELTKLMSDLGMPQQGASLPEFQKRLAACSLLTRIAQDDIPASAIHWVQSDQIFKPAVFEAMGKESGPSLIHIHPFLFGDGNPGAEEPKVGIRTYGAAHFIGREVLLNPSVLPWGANYETILAFLRVATTQNGYIIPDGDTFGPEDRSLSYRVRHLDAKDGDPAYYELEPLMHREFGLQSDSYVPREQVFDDRSISQAMPASKERDELEAEWQAKRAMAEGIGGRFEVRARAPGGPPPFGRRAVFGRKQQ